MSWNLPSCVSLGFCLPYFIGWCLIILYWSGNLSLKTTARLCIYCTLTKRHQMCGEKHCCFGFGGGPSSGVLTVTWCTKESGHLCCICRRGSKLQFCDFWMYISPLKDLEAAGSGVWRSVKDHSQSRWPQEAEARSNVANLELGTVAG